jgi:putative GTP pyrophosphokinase
VREHGLSALRGDDSPDDVEVVTWWRDEHVQPMLAVYSVVERLAPPLPVNESAIPLVSYRPKRLTTIADKLTREPGKLTDMADLGGVRAVVASMRDVDSLVADLGRELEIRRTRDWARKPRQSGYRAVHLHVVQGGRLVEVQVRTVGQDTWANVVEQESRLSGLNYKAGQGQPEVLEFYACVSDLVASIELGESHPDLGERLLRAHGAARPYIKVPQFAKLEP